MALEKKDIIQALTASVKELQQGIDMHCCLVAALLDGRVDEQNLGTILHSCPKRARELRLEKAIQEAIDELEETRKAFKSKKLEFLRKKLTRSLLKG